MKKITIFIISVAIPIGVGLLSSYFTQNSSELYQSLSKPFFAPPGVVFPIIWAILYVLMGISLYLVYIKGRNNRQQIVLIFLLQLGLNFFWSILFFSFEAYFIAFLWILALLYAIYNMIKVFSEENRGAALLQIPYFVWVCFAAGLNLAIAILN